jgi:hypothetical protein
MENADAEGLYIRYRQTSHRTGDHSIDYPTVGEIRHRFTNAFGTSREDQTHAMIHINALYIRVRDDPILTSVLSRKPYVCYIIFANRTKFCSTWEQMSSSSTDIS